jgi:hypothetical protein
MRARPLLAAAVLCAVPSAATAQLANHSISVESGLSAALGGGGPAAATVALAATRWLEGLDRGDLDGVLRVALGSAPRTAGRAASSALAATAGLRLSIGRAPLRPQLLADLGWARLRGAAAASRIAWGLGAALEWFPAPDVSLSARAALRGAGVDAAAEGALGLAAYF